jgi:hypothetical protein
MNILRTIKVLNKSIQSEPEFSELNNLKNCNSENFKIRLIQVQTIT